MRSWTTTELLASVKDHAAIPTRQDRFDDPALLRIATELITRVFQPEILKLREEYYVKVESYSVTAGDARYRIPPRAIGLKLRDAKLVDSAGNESSVTNIPYEYVTGTTGFYSFTGTGYSFYFEGDELVLTPTPTSGGLTLKLPYYRRPGKLVATSAAARITALIDADSVTVNALPASFAVGTSLDIIRDQPGFDWLNIDLTRASGSINFSSAYSTEVAVNDWVALADESPIPQILPEYHPALAMATAKEVRRMQGNLDAVAALDADLKREMQEIRGMLTPRNDGEVTKLVPRFSTLRTARRHGVWWR